MAITDIAANDRSAGKTNLPSLEHNRLIQRQTFELVVFSKEDAKQNGAVRDLHGHIHFILLRLAATRYPAHTAIRQHTTDAPIFAPARTISPSCIKLSVCRLNDENVVKPPQKPVITNCRVVELT